MKYKDTSLPISERVEDLVSRMTLKEKLMVIIETSKENERLGIPKYYHGNEALHGVVRPAKSTVFPQAIGFGSMFDPELLEVIADAISDESRAVHHHGRGTFVSEELFDGRYNGLLTFWSPDLNVCRDPRWGRTGETYGEDPYLAGKNGASFVRGIQGKHPKYLKAVSTPKHFTGNNEEHNRFSCNAVMSEKSLREYYLKPFRIAVEEGHPEAVMAAYNAINGLPCHENHRLLTDILRGEWGFDGYVVSDCSAIARMWDSHHRYDQPEDAASAAMNAGVDLECGSFSPYEHFYYEFLEKQIADGKTTEERITQACTRVLTARFKLGQFDPDEDNPFSKIPITVVGCEKHKNLAYVSATESIVLLKNNGILPLDNTKKVAVVGNNADICQFGDYSGKPYNEPVSPLAGLKKTAGDKIKFVEWTWHPKDSYEVIKDKFLMTEDGQPGLKGEYFGNTAFLGKYNVRTDAAIDFAWRNQMPDSYVTTPQYAIRWTGFVCPDKSGVYMFKLTYSGNAPCELPEITIDGRKLGTQFAITFEGGKKYPVVVEYRKADENPSVKLEWSMPDDANADPFAAECEAAKNADVTVAVVGLGTNYECEGRDKDTLNLPPEQEELLRRLFEVSKNVITVLVNGSPVTVPEIHDGSAAVIEAWYPGEQGGRALADILYGNVVPSGRLCATFPFTVDDLPAFDDYEMSHGRTYMYSRKKPLYPFGFGLSYNEYKYSNISIKASENGFTASVDVTNLGSRTGDEVVQVYLDSAGMESQPFFRLVRFKRTKLAAGETKTVSFELNKDCFVLYNDEGKEFDAKGIFKLYIGGSLPTERSLELGASEWQEAELELK